MSAIEGREQPIARCECAMLPLVLLAEGQAFRGRDVLWLVDNTAALGGVVRGNSRHPVLDKLLGLYGVLAYRFQLHIWVEYVDSESNWSDGISRLFGADDFAARHGFTTSAMHIEPEWLRLSASELWEKSRRFES